MRRFKYEVLSFSSESKASDIKESLNSLSNNGWRLQTILKSGSSGSLLAVMEKESKENNLPFFKGEVNLGKRVKDI